MRRPSRNIEIFSLSALDLFACALGAFIIVTILLFPFYQKTLPLMQQVSALSSQLAASQAAAQDQAQQIEQLKGQLQQAQAQAADIGKLQAQVQALQRQLAQQAATPQPRPQPSRFVILGIDPRVKSYVILVDMSGSIAQVRWQGRVLNTFASIVKDMDASYSIQVIGFQGDGGQTRLPQWLPGNQLAPLNPQNKAQATSFVQGLMARVDGGTPTLAALRAALEYDAEAIILISDGAPSPDGSAPYVVSEITRLNAGRKIIHCVAVGNFTTDTRFIEFLTQLAERNNGQVAASAGIRP
ncbi:MAG: vWA domain-containing protein [Reyranellaceae bacterium]